VPAAQSAHPPASVVALVVALPCPAGHFEAVHEAALAAAHVPAPQSVQLLRLLQKMCLLHNRHIPQLQVLV